MSPSTALWFGVAGVLAVVRWILDLSDTQYYDPESVLDYSAVISQSAAAVATGIALLLLWREPPVGRGSFLLAVAGLAAIAQGVGNLIEDTFDIGAGEWGFFLGGIGMIFALFGAGVLALTAKSPMRWSGLFLIVGATGGMLGIGLLFMGLAWLAFSIWIAANLKRTAGFGGLTPN